VISTASPEWGRGKGVKMVIDQLEVRTFDESNAEKLVVYRINGENYSEGIVRHLIAAALKIKEWPPECIETDAHRP
jgi:hypothetical protein